MSKKSHILFSYIFNSDGKAEKLDRSRASEELKKEGLTWVHLDANSSKTQEWIKKEVNYLDHLIIDALTAEETRPRITEFAEGLMIILRGINLDSNAQPEDMVSIRLWIDHDRIISVQRRDMQAVTDIKNQIEDGKLIKDSGEFLYNLLYQILSVTSPFLYSLGDKLDILEEKVLTTHNAALREDVLQIRSQAVTFKRYLSPQKEAIAKLKVCDHEWLSDWTKRHFQENLDKISMMIEEVDEVRDRANILSDELFNSLTARINNSMYSLSLVASIFIPLTFFTSVLSVNIGGIPGAKDDSAFMWMVLGVALMALIQLIIFKKKNLF